MQEVMTGHVAQSTVPGMVMLLSRRGEVHVEAIGMQAFDGSEPMRRDTIFRIASVTKPIVAAAAMILVEECTLRLDEPVDQWLPELADRRVLRAIDSPLDDTLPANRPITLRDLLTFRLGIGSVMVFPPRYPIQQAMAEVGVGPGPALFAHTPDELMKRFGSLPLVHQPGERWLYDSGSDILGVLISRATGMSLEEFLREVIFAPLGMNDTSFSVPESKLNRLASSYWSNPSTGKFEIFDGVDDSRWASPPVFESGAGGLISTVDDLLAFGEMMLKRGKVPERAHPIATVGRVDDDRPNHPRAESDFRLLSRLLGQPWLGIRRLHRDPARRLVGNPRTLRLGWWLRHVVVRGPQGGVDRDPDDPVPLGCLHCSDRPTRFLDLSLRGDRRLRHLIA